MSHLQGTDYVGSMVVVEDGWPTFRLPPVQVKTGATTTARPWKRC
jgi:hypothetical protein